MAMRFMTLGAPFPQLNLARNGLTSIVAAAQSAQQLKTQVERLGRHRAATLKP